MDGISPAVGAADVMCHSFLIKMSVGVPRHLDGILFEPGFLKQVFDQRRKYHRGGQMI